MTELRVFLKDSDFLLKFKGKDGNYLKLLLLYRDLRLQSPENIDLALIFEQILTLNSILFVEDRIFLNEMWPLLQVLLLSPTPPWLFLELLKILSSSLDGQDKCPRIDLFSRGTPGLSVLLCLIEKHWNEENWHCLAAEIKIVRGILVKESSWEGPLIGRGVNEEISVFLKKFGYKSFGKIGNWIEFSVFIFEFNINRIWRNFRGFGRNLEK